MKHLLVTNDFPPKIGGIQSYLWELWRRLPADEVTVLASAYPGAGEFDRAAGFRIERSTDKVLLPRRAVLDHIEAVTEPVVRVQLGSVLVRHARQATRLERTGTRTERLELCERPRASVAVDGLGEGPVAGERVVVAELARLVGHLVRVESVCLESADHARDVTPRPGRHG